MTIISILILVNVHTVQARDKLRTVGTSVTVMLNESAFSENETGRYLSGVAFNEGVNIYLIGQDGSVLYPSNVNADEPYVQKMLQAAQKHANQDRESIGAIYSIDDKTMSFSSVIGNAENYYLVVNYPMQVVTSTAQSYLIYVIVICAIAILVAFIVSYFISLRLAAPINSISEGVGELAKGNYDVKFTSSEYAEVAQLSDTLNYMTEEIKKSDEFQKQLLANVSHDLKTPLTMIKAYASMVQEISGDDPAKREKHLQVIIDESDRLTGLVNDVLNVSKVSTNTALNKKVFNLTDLVYGIVGKFNYLQETQGYNIMVDIDPNLYTCADEEKISQVLYNLMSNAVNYTGEDKSVYVSVKDYPAENRIKFSVRDTGRGIAKADIPNIWNRFYRIKENHARPVKGTGLGLSIVQIILKNHCFDFGVNSQVGKGSTFWVDFPSVPALGAADEE